MRKISFSDVVEQKVQKLFLQLGVSLSKLPEAPPEKRPDFEGQLIDCRIIVEVSHFSDLVSQSEAGEDGFYSDLKLSADVDPQHRKLLNKIWDKLPQLTEYDPKHECFRVLALVSNEEFFDQGDMRELLTGKSVFESDTGDPTEIHQRVMQLVPDLDFILFYAPELDCDDGRKVWRGYRNQDSARAEFALSLVHDLYELDVGKT